MVRRHSQPSRSVVTTLARHEVRSTLQLSSGLILRVDLGRPPPVLSTAGCDPRRRRRVPCPLRRLQLEGVHKTQELAHFCISFHVRGQKPFLTFSFTEYVAGVSEPGTEAAAQVAASVGRGGLDVGVDFGDLCGRSLEK